MKVNEISISDNFKTQLTKTKLSIVLFVIVYIILFLLAIGLTIASMYGGVMLIVLFPRLITLALGMGLASFGLLIFIFLIKFIFKSHKVDYSNLIEIHRKDEPKLFKMLDELTQQIGTDFPKKVFISSDVNAGVFYNSSFWSMFFPIKKNLQIGLGLVNTTSKEELKAILSHEFGHFSQKSMKTGSYVYNVNQVIFNMLYENQSFEKLAQRWTNTTSYIGVFVVLAFNLIQGIQWILQKFYEIINKNYLALSREMEFHADEIAAHVTGYEPLMNSLLRMELADSAYNSVITFYNERIENGIVSKNIFKEQLFVMNFLAKEDELDIIDGFPKVTLDDLNKYNKSKLNIKDQWASHPSIKDRIEHLKKTNLKSGHNKMSAANQLFSNIVKTQERVTKKMFKDIKTQEKQITLEFDEFKKDFVESYLNNSFSKIYNGYYNDKNPTQIDLSQSYNDGDNYKIEELFSNEKVDLVYTRIALKNDIDTLKLISKKEIKVKTFDYDSVKYKRKDSQKLQEKLIKELEEINHKLKENDLKIYKYFKQKERQRNKNKLVNLYNTFLEFDSEIDAKINVYKDLIHNLQFIHHTIEVNEIKRNFEKIKYLEKKLKRNITELLENNVEMTPSVKNKFELYLSKDWKYIGVQQYFEKNLLMLFDVLDHYIKTLTQVFFIHKKQLLDYQISLL